MKLTVFQSDKGDCLLLTGADGKTILADGGMRSSFSDHVAPTLGRLARAKKPLDLVYVSHIDQDHISGVLQLLDDAVAWRVFDFQRSTGNRRFRQPKAPRPPEIKALWHNAFKDQVRDNRGEIEEQLVTTMKTLGVDQNLSASHGETFQNLVTSKREALLVSQRAGREQLDIPVNPEFRGRLMVRSRRQLKVGGMKIRVIGPSTADLRKLRKDWNEWLAKNQDLIDRLRRKAREDRDRLRLDEGTLLRQAMFTLASELGRRNLVTVPNLASLMLLVEEAGKTILLTGDGHGDDILDGLKHNRRLDRSGGIHVDVLKVQHHGSEHNMDAKFARAVTADNYVFCGNGAHKNPDERIVKLIIDSRLGSRAQRSRNAQAGRSFKLWFNSSSKVAESSAHKKHMRKIEKLVRDRARGSRRLRFRFLNRGSKFGFGV